MPTTVKSQLNKKVFGSASAIIIALLVYTAALPQQAQSLFTLIQTSIIENGSWFYVLTVAFIFFFVIFLGVSRYGDIRLGPDHSTPDYTLVSWLSMLFAAGMGIGLMFFGVAEPLMHYLSPPTAETGTVEAVQEAMKMTFFHWGLHAWAIYAIVALVLAYFSYRHNLPLTLRSALYPLIGDRIYKWPGHLVDIFAVVSTVFGVATSLGLGASQVNAGFGYLFGIEVSVTNQIIIMFGITSLAVISVATGLDKGIKILSETNMVLAVILLFLIFVLGPTVFLLQAYLQNIGDYLADIVHNTFNLFAYKKTDWIGGWTIFYWGWWLAWAPFVGLFIARISRGRTIREFIIGVMLIPTVFTLFWMTIFGNSAIDLVYNQGIVELGEMVSKDSSVALFVFLENFPLSSVLSFFSVLMIVIFFVTSCDSGAMVVDMLCSHGKNDTPLWQRVYWAVGIGIVAAILLLAGGLNALQTMTIASALPFTIVLLLAIAGLIKSLRVEAFKQDSQLITAIPHSGNENSDSWQMRLKNVVDFPNKANVSKFVTQTVVPAFDSVAKELQANQINVEISHDDGLTLIVDHGEAQEFVYRVLARKYSQPDYVIEANEAEDEQSYYRAEVHLGEGGQDYDIMGWSKTAVINNIIDQYHKHLHFLHLLR
ncbi:MULTISPECIES: choline BCCT transporter BetT [unclassified Colwellia]|uniref:BCCT family transporter n=1 Tax=unclassified Colwellia TaxID=196834 RepID=UPI0015F7649E|nr:MULTISPECIES: choline BCCT transporter BetT [unclassified Colwellia]MBA6364251.1 BCCT family transporter [Colwellia sp. BRX8-8]MBA6348346.1 BCCT family transporter [Colwellia sp. BRX8-9]MBA6352571.1 BCCT family transporter [Colwellia sp. BRX9-1]MBA6355849.1 BCCT family transporter [Colwellia sp. BRX8-3]MBA6359502.1 BCCT family transporter [Colwellia sp. BRX8-6]